MLDASVLVEFLAPGPASESLEPLFASETRFEYWAPDLCLFEAANALRKRFLRERRFTRPLLEQAVGDLMGLRMSLVGSALLLAPAVRHADALNLYDAAYVTLAESMGVPLCTLDGGLAARARRIGVAVLAPGTPAFERWLGEP